MTRVLVIVMVGLFSACGVVGAPVPPETIGVAPMVEQQQRQQAEAMKSRQQEGVDVEDIEEPYPSLQGEDEDLLPQYPVGTR